jgi:hypothetical protein
MKHDASTLHAKVVIRLQGPRHWCHDPVDGLSSQPLNYVHNWTSPDQPKRSDHTWKACPLAWNFMWKGLRSASWDNRRIVVVASGYATVLHQKWWSQRQREVVPTQIDIDEWDLERRPSVSLYLDELPIQKCQFRDRFNVSIFSLERLSPRGSCHLDESSMNHTLAQKYLIELLMWNASDVQKHFN